MRSTPWPCVSTRCTLGRLKVSRYWSWKQGRLQNWLYQGFKRLGGGAVLDHRIDPRAHPLHLQVVGLLDAPGRRRSATSPGHRAGLAACGGQQDVGDQVGPAIVDQVDLEAAATRSPW